MEVEKDELQCSVQDCKNYAPYNCITCGKQLCGEHIDNHSHI